MECRIYLLSVHGTVIFVLASCRTDACDDVVDVDDVDNVTSFSALDVVDDDNVTMLSM